MTDRSTRRPLRLPPAARPPVSRRFASLVLFAAVTAGVLLASAGCSRQPATDTAVDTTGSAPPDVSTVPAADDTAGVMIHVSAPLSDDAVSSPLVVRGMARGPWYFEASFPVRLVDPSGRTIAQAPAQAQAEWMTPGMVPFEATIEFQTTSPYGRLVLEKSNASGLPEHADSLVIPIRFRTGP